MSLEESISLEETNKIRISLGLKPLTETLRQLTVRRNRPRTIMRRSASRRRRSEMRTRPNGMQSKFAHIQSVPRVRNRRELNASLKGSTLGDADGDDDTLKWIKRNKKKEKELAKKRQEELEDMDKQLQAEYTERDLAGLKVSHDFEELDEGEARVLTLKDSRVLDDEEDELQNVEMAEDERTKKRNDLKIKRRDYTGYDDDEFTAGNANMKRAILAKYDEDLGLTAPESVRQLDTLWFYRTAFLTVCTGISTWKLLRPATKAERAKKKEKEAAASVNKSLLSIDYASTLHLPLHASLASDRYRKLGARGLSARRRDCNQTKKKRANRRAAADAEPAPEDAMEVDVKPVIPRVRDLDANFVDDDELQAMLARSRKAKVHKPKKLSPEELAKKSELNPSTIGCHLIYFVLFIVAGERTGEASGAPQDIIKVEDGEEDQETGLVFDDTSEFVRAVGLNPVVKREPPEASAVPARAASPPRRSPSRDVSMAPGDQALEELEAGRLPSRTRKRTTWLY
ncbi:SART-1 protein [Salix suchowensis]|nr:SART-1 protein [Salix suchowensis]